MDLRISQTPSQKLILTMAMRQAFKVLMMPIVELGTFVGEQIEANPLIERIESSFFWDAYEVEAPLSLFEYLMQQVQIGDFSMKERQIAEEIIGNLDERGFYTGPLQRKTSVLKKIQLLDPPGIGARNLQECLLIQLEAQGKKGSSLYNRIQNDFENCKDLVKGLDFAPGLKFQATQIQPIVPDVILDEEVVINEEGLPEFELSMHYKKYQEQGVDAQYLRQHLAKAKWLVRNLDKRSSILKGITEFLIEKNPGYFRGESKIFNETSVSAIASALELNPSTVSRAIANKILFCKAGMIPFRNFLQKNTAKQRLQELIAKETVPLSDEELAKKLNSARRTIAKYRKELNIPPARKRA